jgi:hypothetical protein
MLKEYTSLGVRALFRRGQEKNGLWYGRLRRRAAWTGALAAALALFVLASQGLAYTPPIVGADGKPLPGSIAGALTWGELIGMEETVWPWTSWAMSLQLGLLLPATGFQAALIPL